MISRSFRVGSLGVSLLALSIVGCSSDDASEAPTDAADDTIVPSDDGSDTDAQDEVDTAPGPCSGPGAAPDAWSTLGHDARRTSASNGCVHETLTELWHFDGKAAGETFYGFYNAVADKDAVYAHPAAAGTPVISRVAAATGKQTWSYHGSADYPLGHWLTLGLDRVAADDDGLYFVSTSDGKIAKSAGVDWWGQTAADDKRFYVVTSVHGDGPGAFVDAWDPAKGELWKANQQGSCDPALGDSNGAIAVDGDTLYFAPHYIVNSAMGGVSDATGAMYASGLYAFDAAAGTKKWSVSFVPHSAISVDASHIYLVEAGPALVARNKTDGSVAWSAPLTDDLTKIAAQPPVLAGGKVIIAAADQVLSFDAASGKAGWKATVARAAYPGFGYTVINFLSCKNAPQPAAPPAFTTLAAATASDTLIVTGSDGVHVLSLMTGTELGKVGTTNTWNPIIVGDRVYAITTTAMGAQQLIAYQAK